MLCVGCGALGARLWCGLGCLVVVVVEVVGMVGMVGMTGDAARTVVDVAAAVAVVVATGIVLLFASVPTVFLFARSGLPCRDFACLIVFLSGCVPALVVVLVVVLGAARGDRGDLVRVALAVLILRPVTGSYLVSFTARLLRARRTCGVVVVAVVAVFLVMMVLVVVLVVELGCIFECSCCSV